MKLSTDMPQLLNSHASVNIGLKQAIALLNAPEEIRETVTAKIEAGEDVTIKEIQRLKKEAAELAQDKESLQNDLIAKIEVNARELEELKKVRRELDAEVGALAIHKDAIKNIKIELASLTMQFSDAFDTGTIPNEVTGDWGAIYGNWV